MKNAWENIVNAIKNLGCAFNHVLQGFNNLGHPPLTKYHCSRCKGNLILVDHDATIIFYKCIVCGKIHQARKSRVLGRF